MGIELVKALFNTVMVTAGVTMIWFMIGLFISKKLGYNPKYHKVRDWMGYISFILLVLTVISFMVFMVVAAIIARP